MKMAQPDKATGASRVRQRIEAICSRLEEGTPISHACALEYVATSSFYWLCEHDEEIAAQVAHSRAIAAEKQRAELRDAALGGIEGANANVLLHLIERAHPDEYAPPKQRVEKSGPDGGPIQIERRDSVDALTDEQTIRAAREVLAELERRERKP